MDYISSFLSCFCLPIVYWTGHFQGPNLCNQTNTSALHKLSKMGYNWTDIFTCWTKVRILINNIIFSIFKHLFFKAISCYLLYIRSYRFLLGFIILFHLSFFRFQQKFLEKILIKHSVLIEIFRTFFLKTFLTKSK